MKDNSIFYYKPKTQKYPYSLECTYALAYLSVYQYNKLSVEGLTKTCKKYGYSESKVLKNSAIKRFVRENINMQIDLETKTNISNFLNFVNLYKNKYKEELSSLFCEKVKINSNSKIDIIELAVIKDLMLRRSNRFISFETSFTFIFFKEKIEKLHQLFLEIPKENYKMKLDYFFNDEFESKVFSVLNIYTFGELIEFSKDLIYPILSHEFDSLLKIVINLTKSINDLIKSFDENIKTILNKDKEYYVFYYRFATNENQKSLQAIGDEFKVTRERIRQIEKNVLGKLKAVKMEFYPYISLFFANNFYEKMYISSEEMVELVGDEFSYGIIKALIKIYSTEYKYDPKYEIFYLDGYLNEVIEDSLLEFDIIVSNSQFKELKGFQKRLVQNNYRKRANGILLRIGCRQAEIYCRIVEELFPDGIETTDESANAINEEIKKKYKDLPPINGHTLQALLARCDYCFIDRGTVIHRSKANKLNEELIDEIIAYIYEVGEVVRYAAILNRFKNELNDLGITNYYYLKGALDMFLPKDITPQRDYLFVGKKQKSLFDVFIDVVNNTKGVITIDYLDEKIPGVEPYLMINYVNRINAIWIVYGKKFYLVDKLNITDELIKALKDEIEILFKDLNSTVITSNKLFSQMKTKHLELMNLIPEINNHFALFSLVQKVLSNDYFFHRPYISKDKNYAITTSNIIDNYVNTLCKYNVQILSSFTKKMNMRNINNFLDFFISHSSNFVQVTENSAVKKECLNLKDNVLNELKDKLILYINNHKVLDTRTFNSYLLFPELKIPWNKYLLVGIIRTYMDDLFYIEYTDNMYTLTDFIVKNA